MFKKKLKEVIPISKQLETCSITKDEVLAVSEFINTTDKQYTKYIQDLDKVIQEILRRKGIPENILEEIQAEKEAVIKENEPYIKSLRSFKTKINLFKEIFNDE